MSRPRTATAGRFRPAVGYVATAGLIALAASTGCRPLLRYPVADPRPDTPVSETLLDTMNPFVLTNLISDRLVVEIDWIDGYQPSAKALNALHSITARYLPPDKRVEIVVDDRIPRERWEAHRKEHGGFRSLMAEFVDHDPGRWREYELVYVLYAPDAEGWTGDDSVTGLKTDATFERDGEPVTVTSVLLFSDAIHRASVLWIGDRKVERSTLVHEFGHVLGLTQNPTHTQRKLPHHCTEPQCVMPHPRVRSILYNLIPGFFAGRMPADYCKKCRADIRSAQALWDRQRRDGTGVIETIETRRLAHIAQSAGDWHREGLRFEKTLDAYERAIELEPGDADLLLSLGRAHMDLWNPEPAYDAFREAERLEGGCGARYWAAYALCDLGRCDEVLESLDRESIRTRADIEGYLLLERAMLRLGRYEEAAARWEELLSSSFEPDERLRPLIYYELAACYRLAGDPERAEAALHRLSAELPRNFPLEIAIAELARASRPEEAAARLRQLLKYAREDGYLPGVARAAALLGDETAARQALSELDDAGVEGRPRALLRAQVLALLGDADGTLDALEALRRQGYSRLTDPCTDPGLEPARRHPRFAELFPHCPR